MYSRKELKIWFEDMNFPPSRSIGKRVMPEIYSSITEHTKFLDEHISPATMGLRCHCIIEDVFSIPMCPSCGSLCKKSSIKDEYGYYGFTKFCSRKCGDPARIERLQQGTMEKYGSKNPMKVKELQEKARKTHKKLNLLDPSREEEIREKKKKTILERYGPEGLANEEIREKTRQTNIERYGTDNPIKNAEVRKKIQDTLLEKYGTTVISHIEGVREKAKKTTEERYGNSVYFKTDSFIKKSSATCNDRYGVDFYVQSNEFTKKRNKTMKEKYGVEHIQQLHIDKDVIDMLADPIAMKDVYDEEGFVRKMAKRLGVDKNTISRRLKGHGIAIKHAFSSSAKEKELLEYVKSLYNGTVIESSSSIIHPKQLDLYLPDIGLAFEFNGLYWHSSKFKDTKYHQEKSMRCMERGVRLIHIWEDDWDRKQEVVKNIIRRSLGVRDDEKVYARNCTFDSDVPYQEAKEILQKHHIQGSIKNGIRVGLRHKDTKELVACCVFSDKGEKDFELTRYVTSRNVLGGLSKIIKNFIKETPCRKIVSFARLDLSYGDLYEKVGFTEVHLTPPSLWYVDINQSVRMPRHSFMKHKLPSLLEGYDDFLTEKQNMINHGFIPLYDSGMIKYEMLIQ